MKKILLTLIIAGFTVLQVNSKDCGCSEGNASYSWSVEDGRPCSAITPNSTATMTLTASNGEKRTYTVPVQDAVDFCL